MYNSPLKKHHNYIDIFYIDTEQIESRCPKNSGLKIRPMKIRL